ncbi:MAG TPA: hypothetical protein VK947_12770 [Planococcus sp. (in: firmicutes)]|nr:hypothetical protein [Planococcus sp. (in: firmicutes)]
MKTIKNERGYALLMVLMLILLFTVLGMSLMATNMNSAKQFSTKESQVQARHYAEMGLLHYQVLVDDVVKEYKFTATKDRADSATSSSRVELCNKIRGIGNVEKAHIKGSYQVPPVELTGCSSTDKGKINITMKSTGKVGSGKTKMVEGNMGVTPPVILASEVDPVTGPLIPTKPVNDTGQPPITTYPPSGDVRGFVEINGPFPIHRTSYHFESFVINSSPTVNALIAGGGKSGDTLKIEKDFYIGGGVYSNNYICIYVQGDLTILGNIDLGPHSLILVYGDAYFKGSVITNPNAKIHVIGNTYLGASKTITNDYKNFPGYTKDCESIVTWPDPVEVAQTGKEYQWNLDTNLNAIYH